jgi:hypothetical protein
MQNKAVINEEKANDVNLLREQIRQLKVGDTHARLSFTLNCLMLSLASISSGNTFHYVCNGYRMS